MTEQALLKAKIDLFNIISNHARESYKRANLKTNGQKKSYKHIPYSLNDDCNEAREVYKLVYGKKAEEVTKETETIVKAFLMPYRTHRREYLKEGVKGGNWYYSNK